MRGRSSSTVSGGRCRRRRRWCRELRLGWICCGRDVAAPAVTNRANSKKRNFLFSKFVGCQFLVLSKGRFAFFFRLAHSLPVNSKASVPADPRYLRRSLEKSVLQRIQPPP